MTSGPSNGAGEDRPIAWPGDPELVSAADIDFEALAHVLANTCRRGGRMRQYHSLAAHAVVVSEEIEALHGLSAEDQRTLGPQCPDRGRGVGLAQGRVGRYRTGPGSRRQARRGGRTRAPRGGGLDPVLGEEQAELLRFVERMVASAECRDLLDGEDAAGGALAFPPCRRRIRPLAPDRAARMWLSRLQVLRETAGSGRTPVGSDAARG